jgi:hypothetical protein
MEQTDPALEEARRAGIDLDLLDSNLALTYEERALRHQRKARFCRRREETCIQVRLGPRSRLAKAVDPGRVRGRPQRGRLQRGLFQNETAEAAEF